MIVSKVLAVAIILLFIGMSVIPSTGTVVEKKFSMPINYDGNTYDVVVTDISFSLMKIVATVENRGVVDANVNITFSVSKGIILPWVIGHSHVTVPAGETIQVTQRFTGLGRYTFWARIDECGTSLSTKGFWFLFFGWEIQ